MMVNEIDYEILPAHMREGARGYLEAGHKPGGFLRAVLENDLVAAYARADDTNIWAMRDWAAWLYDECPVAAWGSKAKVDAWIRARRADRQGA